MEKSFEWDEKKAKENIRNHKISFEEAATIFEDPFSITIPNPDHSIGEDRYIDVGCSSQGRLLIVVYTERGPNIRIISGRKAEPNERRKYEEGDL